MVRTKRTSKQAGFNGEIDPDSEIWDEVVEYAIISLHHYNVLTGTNYEFVEALECLVHSRYSGRDYHAIFVAKDEKDRGKVEIFESFYAVDKDDSDNGYVIRCQVLEDHTKRDFDEALAKKSMALVKKPKTARALKTIRNRLLKKAFDKPIEIDVNSKGWKLDCQRYATKCIKIYNDGGTDYVVSEVLKVVMGDCRGRIFELSFVAKDEEKFGLFRACYYVDSQFKTGQVVFCIPMERKYKIRSYNETLKRMVKEAKEVKRAEKRKLMEMNSEASIAEMFKLVREELGVPRAPHS